MINILSVKDGILTEFEDFQEGCWTNLADPTDEEIEKVVDFYGVDKDFITASLDEEESAQLEAEGETTLVLVDIPVVQPDDHNSFLYSTLPLGIVICAKGMITICSRESNIMEDFMTGRVRMFSTNKKTRFLLQILYRNAVRFLQYLKQIDKASTIVEHELHKSMRNRELIQMLRLEKSLVYFSTSLKGNEAVLEKLLRTQAITRYEDDEDLLEDVITENKQAIEMCTIYRDILGGTMDAFASVISNNLNIVMKWLAALTIVLAIPQIVFGLFGMNTGVPWESSIFGFWNVIAIAIGLSGVAAFIMWKKDMF